MLKLIQIVFLGFIVLSLNSCSSLEANPTKKHQNLCNQIKNRILMSGRSYSDTRAEQERAELGKLNASFRSQGCN